MPGLEGCHQQTPFRWVALIAPVLEGVIVKVASTSKVAIVIVATTPEVVDVKVGVFLVVIRLVVELEEVETRGNRGLPRHICSVGLSAVECCLPQSSRDRKTSLAHPFAWIASGGV